MTSEELAEKLYEWFGGSVWFRPSANPGLNYTGDWGAMRYQAPDRETLERYQASIAKADARYRLWENSSVAINPKAPVYPDNEPLRFWVPFRFIEPMKRYNHGKDFIVGRNRWWRWAPFEVRQVILQTPAMTYDLNISQEFIKRVDDNNGWDGSGFWIGQITRKITHLYKAKFVIRFRWL